VSWVAAHGGAGASTLTALLGGNDVGCRWPDPDRGESLRVVLVARTGINGMRAASRALEAMRTGRHPKGMELIALVLLADAPGRLPLSLLRRVRVLRSVAPVRRVPWVPEWRTKSESKNMPKAVQKLRPLIEAQHSPDGGRR
jgi:hypothetical protein